MTREVYYWDYLGLDQILQAQKPHSGGKQIPAAHEEMLFIITHQAHELWFKQILHELESVCDLFSEPHLQDDEITVIVRRLSRITEIQKLLIQQINVLKTMTPMDFLEFRDILIPASGFQSVQFRMIEMRMGLHSETNISETGFFDRLQAKHQQLLEDLAQKTSLFDLLEQWLLRTPFLQVKDFAFWSAYQQAVQTMLTMREQQLQAAAHEDLVAQIEQQQLNETTAHFASLFDQTQYAAGEHRLSYLALQAVIFIYLYRDQPVLNLPYQLLSTLVEIDDLFSQWRYNHILLVQRMIGGKMGTGGSSGQEYLKRTLNSHKLFADLENVSTCLIPRSALPPLPQHFIDQLGFHYANN